jgi:hypothetical protein
VLAFERSAHYRDIRACVADGEEGRVTVGRLADQLELRPGADRARYRVPEERLAVDRQHAQTPL